MAQRHVLAMVFLQCWVSLSICGGVHAEEAKKKLNVLFIAADDLNISLGCYGRPVQTPNIDRLAGMGRRFDRAYCQYPLCNPSRTSFLSGLRPETTKVWGNETPPRPRMREAIPLQEHFDANGYYTARVGKVYHGRFEAQFQWDNIEGAEARANTRPAEGRPRQGQRRTGGRPRPGASRPAGGGDAGGMVAVSWRATESEDADTGDGRTARRIAQIIEQSKDRPFFIAAGFSRPHLPWSAPNKYFQMYPPETIRVEKGPDDDRADIPPAALSPAGPGDPKTDEQRAEAIAAYYACVSFVDAQVGVIMEAMDRLKLWDTTVVVFLGDNGFHLGEHGLWRKMTLFEESAHVPLIIVAPGMKQPGTATRSLVEFVDIYPTLVELCGLPEVPRLEGTSLGPILKDPNREVKTATFTVVAHDKDTLGRSIRTDRYRYTQWPGGGIELYDHQTDPHEYVNLARSADHAATVAQMREMLEAGYKAAKVSHGGTATGPLRVHPTNPRYLTNGSGKAIYLTGSHIWNNLQDWGASDPPPPLDFDAHLAFLGRYGHNFTRGWAWEQAKSAPGYRGDFYYAPLPFERTGPGNALDGKPKFDLTRFNPAYFDRLRQRAVAAGQRGLYMSIMLFEGWSIEDKKKEYGNPWPSHPFNSANNINGINGDPNGDNQGLETHSLQVPAVTTIQEKYVRKVIDTLNGLDNIFWEISNESWTDSVAWQYHMIRFIKSCEAAKPKQHLVWMTGYMVPNTSLFESPADCISPCRKDGTDYRANPPATKGDKVIILDTDHIWGVGGNSKWVWKSFTRGYHPIFMDPIEGLMTKPKLDGNAPQWVALRQAMGHTRLYAEKMDLARMTPRDTLASTRYCLANPGSEYLVYQSATGEFTVEMTKGNYRYEWFEPKSGKVAGSGVVSVDSGPHSFLPPVSDDAVLWLVRGPGD